MSPPKRRFFKRRYYKRKPKTQLATVNTVKRLLASNQEHKYFRVYLTGYTLPNVASMYSVNVFTPPQGDGDSDRTGDLVKATSMDFRYQLRGDPLATYDQQARIIVLQWHDMVASFNASNLLMDNTIGDRSILSPYSHDEKNRFTILYDRVHNIGVGPSTTANSLPTLITKNAKVNIKRKKIQFLNAGTSYMANHIFVCVFANVSTYAPTLSFQSVINYTDS